MKESERDDETSDSEESSPVVFTKRIDASESILKLSILVLISVLSFSIRLFAVVRYDSLFHEYDPYFNYRATVYLVKEGFSDFMNWIDSRTWYPMGRLVGQTVYPGLMSTAATVHWAMAFIGFPTNVRNIYVYLAPMLSGINSCFTFLLTSEVADSGAGLLAAAFMGIAPSYASRSVGGVAIFAMTTTLYFLIKALKSGSLGWTVGCSVSYFYMATTWVGYTFLINLIPLYVIIMCMIGRFSSRLYVVYSVFYIFGTLLSMQVLVVRYKAVQSGEHMAALGAFVVLQALAALRYGAMLVYRWCRDLSQEQEEGCEDSRQEAMRLEARWLAMQTVVTQWLGGAVLVLLALAWLHATLGDWWGGLPSEAVAEVEAVAGAEAWPRAGNGSLINATAPLKHLRMMRGRPELLPSTWSAYFLDMHVLAPMTPVGLYFCLDPLSDAKVLVIVYTLTAAYFSGISPRAMVLLCPAVCVCAAVGLSAVLKARLRDLRAGSRDMSGRSRLPQPVAALTVAAVGWLLLVFVQHAVWCASDMYSSRSGGAGGRAGDGWRGREEQRAGVRWMAANLPRNAAVAAWPDAAAGMVGVASRSRDRAGDEDLVGASVLGGDRACGDERLPWPLAMRSAGRRQSAGRGVGTMAGCTDAGGMAPLRTMAGCTDAGGMAPLRTMLGWTEEAAWGALRRQEVEFLVVAHALEPDARDGLLRAAGGNSSGPGDRRSAEDDTGQVGGGRRGAAGGAEETEGSGPMDGQPGGQDGSLMHKLVKHRCARC